VGDAAVTKKRRENTPASIPAVRRGDALDVSALPSYGFSHRSLMWWGNLGMVTIEGVAFAFLIVIYFYLRSLSNAWPDSGRPPDLLFGTLNLGIILTSAIPGYRAQCAAGDRDLRRVRFWLYACSAFGIALCAVRWFEFTALNVRWDEGVYGSIVWVLLGVHSFNLVTNVADTFVLTAVTYSKPVEGKRFVDIAENCGYWDFVVLSWLPIYTVIYFGARF
jgi:cytochrome c oxidase subunit III